MGPTETVFWGAIAGIVTTIVLAVISLVFKKGLIPWYQEIIYKGVDLKGNWLLRETYEDGVTYTCQLNLTQKAHKISGNASMTVMNSGHDYNQIFDIEGETWEGYLTLNMRSKNNTTLSFVAGLLKVEERGASLSGSWAYRGYDEEVKQESIVFRRENG
ncbi:hypothetical protein QNE71_004574 [Vibrio alginolyticus]|nr:hypothetical protein [Vibrio alginolyticus]